MTVVMEASGRGKLGPIDGAFVETDYRFTIRRDDQFLSGNGTLSVPAKAGLDVTSNALMLQLNNGDPYRIIVTRYELVEGIAEFRFAGAVPLR